MFVDSHCHLDLLDLTPFNGSLDSAVQDALHHGVEHVLSVSVTLDRLPILLEQAKRFQHVRVSCGLHPNELPGEVPTVESLIDLLVSDPLIVAVGETGLDTYRSEGDISWQETRFRNHIQAALATSKPLIIHTREARERTLAILNEEEAHRIGGVFHCFTEDWATAEQTLALGFHISLSGIVTFKNAAQIQEVARRVPLDKLLIETDAPFLAPVPMRGKPNFPAYVRHTAQFIADLREVSLDVIAKATTENYYRLFTL